MQWPLKTALKVSQLLYAVVASGVLFVKKVLNMFPDFKTCRSVP